MPKRKVITEEQIIKLFNMDGRQLNKLRSEEKLPYIRVDRFRRLYFEDRIFEWLASREKNVTTGGSEDVSAVM